MNSIRSILLSAICLPVLPGQPPVAKKPDWVLDVAAPATTGEHQLRSGVKVKLQLEFGENSEAAVNADWADQTKDSSWTSKPMVWRHPLKKFSIWINGEQQGIPYEALAGQGDIDGCQVWSNPHLIRVEMDGGDAGISYSLELQFRESKRMKGHWVLSKRVWRHGEFQDEVWDETAYHNEIWDNPDM